MPPGGFPGAVLGEAAGTRGAAPKPFSFSMWDSEPGRGGSLLARLLWTLPYHGVPTQIGETFLSLDKGEGGSRSGRLVLNGAAQVFLVGAEKRRSGIRDSCVNISIKCAPWAESSPTRTLGQQFHPLWGADGVVRGFALSPLPAKLFGAYNCHHFLCRGPHSCL